MKVTVVLGVISCSNAFFLSWIIYSLALFYVRSNDAVYTANSYCHCTANCGVTFPTVVWQYSELLMAVSSPAHCHQQLWVPPNYCQKRNTAVDSTDYHRNICSAHCSKTIGRGGQKSNFFSQILMKLKIWNPYGMSYVIQNELISSSIKILPL